MATNEIRDDRSAEERDRPFLPGMGRVWLLPLYDAFVGLTGMRRLYREAARRAGVGPRQRVLDVGCGTGNLAFAIVRATPTAVVTGLDPDAAALRRAARKARRRRVGLELVLGYADRLPAQDGSIDHVVSSLALHHVDAAGQEGFARDALRVLRQGGRVTVLDFGGPGHEGRAHGDHEHGGHEHGIRWVARVTSGLRRRALQSGEVAAQLESNLARNLEGGIAALLRGAGFTDVAEVGHLEHRLGRLTIVQATRP